MDDKTPAQKLAEGYRQALSAMYAEEIASGKIELPKVEEFMVKLEDVRADIEQRKTQIEKILAIADDDPRIPELERANGGLPLAELKLRAAAAKELINKFLESRGWGE